MKFTTRFAALLALAVTLLLAGCGGGGGGSAFPVEAAFGGPGPSAVSLTQGADGSGATYTIYYPSNLASDGFANPVITYGNGSYAVCTLNLSQAFGQRLASWGFVVVCADSSTTGWGDEVAAAARYMVAENTRAGSIFQGQLDTNAVGAAGHSQGATGALNANTKLAGLIKSTIAMGFVDRELQGAQFPQLSQVTGPVFMAAGCDDPYSTTNDAYFDLWTGPVAKACRKGDQHTQIVPDGLGYEVAWFMYTLRGDSVARSAFVASGGSGPELAQNTDWSGWRSKGLP